MSDFWSWCHRHWLICGTLLLVAGLYQATWIWLGPMPPANATRTPSQSPFSPLAIGAQPSPSALVASSSPTVAVSRAERWRDAFSSSHSLNLRLLVHQAAVSGRVEDIVAAKAAIGRCKTMHRYNSPEASHGGLAAPTEAMRRRVAETREYCADALSLDGLAFRLLHDGGDPQGADLAIRVASGAGRLSADELQRLHAYLRAQGAPELLEASFGAFGGSTGLQAFGWSTDTPSDMLVNDLLLSHAVRLQACRAQRNCAQRAAELLNCRVVNDCVDDLERYAELRIFGPAEQRMPIFAAPTAEAIEAFLVKLEALAIDAGRNPEALRMLKARLLGMCQDQPCLRRRWAQAQAFVAELIGQPVSH